MQSSYIKAMILTDIHILGPRKGHWFDAFKRELQMSSAFKASSQIFQPELYIFLGDQFDEGLTAKDHEFNSFVKRFDRLFPIPNQKLRILVPGNHDIGFHDRFVYVDSHYLERFLKTYNTSDVQLISIKGINFVTLNSMVLDDDGCFLCYQTFKEIKRIARILKSNCTDQHSCTYNRPILIQHFPFFRVNDYNCNEIDSPLKAEKGRIYEPKIDCVSKSSTEFVLEMLTPRLAFSGHTHAGCIINHTSFNTIEYTVASFNARNQYDPNFLLAYFSKDDYLINKCFVPTERAIIASYILGIIFIVFIFH